MLLRCQIGAKIVPHDHTMTNFFSIFFFLLISLLLRNKRESHCINVTFSLLPIFRLFFFFLKIFCDSYFYTCHYYLVNSACNWRVTKLNRCMRFNEQIGECICVDIKWNDVKEKKWHSLHNNWSFVVNDEKKNSSKKLYTRCCNLVL